jgi:hypothetical protein
MGVRLESATPGCEIDRGGGTFIIFQRRVLFY